MDHRVLALLRPVAVTITVGLFRSYEIRPAGSFPLDLFRFIINDLRKSMVKVTQFSLMFINVIGVF